MVPRWGGVDGSSGVQAGRNIEWSALGMRLWAALTVWQIWPSQRGCLPSYSLTSLDCECDSPYAPHLICLVKNYSFFLLSIALLCHSLNGPGGIDWHRLVSSCVAGDESSHKFTSPDMNHDLSFGLLLQLFWLSITSYSRRFPITYVWRKESMGGTGGWKRGSSLWVTISILDKVKKGPKNKKITSLAISDSERSNRAEFLQQNPKKETRV